MNAAESALDFDDFGELDSQGRYWDTDERGRLTLVSYDPEVTIANNMKPRGEREYFYLDEHPDEWILVEFMMDFANDRVSLWINEIQQVNNYPMDFMNTSASLVEISGFTLDTSRAFDYFIDDFVVSTSYIGPRRESEGDTSAPTTSGHSPAKNATSVPANTNISLHVLDSGDGVNRSSIVMTVNGQTVTPTITGSPADYTVSYDPPVDFSPGQTVTVTLDASDLHNPPNVMPKESYSFTVAADTKPPAAPKSLRVN